MKHNVYFQGFENIEFSDGKNDFSVGVIEPGTYNFTAERQETVQCLTGLIEINNQAYAPGQSAVIEKGEAFTIGSKETSSYLCIYR